MNRRRLTQLLVLCAVMLIPAIALADDASGTYGNLIQKHGKLVAVLASFGFGFLASLTPCVYPMVPITVSIFGATEAKSRWRGAALSATFVLGIAALFTPMGIASAMSGKLMGSALSNSFVVIGLAILFAALAASMFGAFELALPSGLNNKLSSVGGIGYKGAFIMGLVMGLIAAPCTGPFLTGMVTVIATSKSVVLGAASLFSFALGLGVLFFIAGAFAVGLPKGGAWMMGIKWVSGVGLAYMSFAYLRDRFEPFRNLIAHPGYAFGIATGALFLVGIILGIVHVVAERRKSPIAHLSKPVKLASIIPAVVGCAAFLSWLPQAHNVNTTAVPMIAWVTNEEAGRAKAISENKPVLIDFGAEWCAGCKELEHDTFPDTTVRTEAQRFVAIRVDATDDDAPDTKRLSEKYKVVGLPTVIMLDANGKEIARLNQFTKPDKFLEAMKKVPAASNAVGMK